MVIFRFYVKLPEGKAWWVQIVSMNTPFLFAIGRGTVGTTNDATLIPIVA